MKSNTSVTMLAASIAAGHPFKHEESARQWLAKLPEKDQMFHMERARLKVYLKSKAIHDHLMSQAVWEKAGL